MANYDHVSEMLDYLVAMQVDCVPTSNAYPGFYYWQESGLYWTNFISDADIQLDENEDIDIRIYTVLMRLHIDKLTAGFRGEKETQMYQTISIVEGYFNWRGNGTRRPFMASATYPNGLDHVHPRGIRLEGWAIDANAVGGTGGGNSADRWLSVVFSLQIPFTISIEEGA